MPYTKTLDDADAYFSPDNHTRSADWRQYEASIRQGALSQSKRELEAYLNRQLEDPVLTDGETNMTSLTDTGIQYRDDWACFEQALEILERQPRQTVGSKTKKLGKPQEDERRGFRISPVALNFARVSRLKIARG